ncbi:MAG: zinc ribbon domain-containing protein, partial [Mycobacterium sp.]|nr:zinc ribbon domain-containing protein [Mycobacterium sp.]
MVNPSSPAPGESRHPVTVTGTLMPHMAAGRHHVYRNVTALTLLAALLAAAFGSLSIALVLAAVALPAVVLTYIHDHNLWHDEPLTVIVVTFALSLVLGVGVGFLQTRLLGIALAAGPNRLPPMSSILELGVLVPVVAFVAVLVAPLLVTARAKFRHPMDVVVTCALSGAALSLGLSVVVQHGAFNHLQATAGYPASVAFIALTLGFLQPVIFATAAAVAVLGLRCAGLNPTVGVVEGVVLLVLYELATTLLMPYGSHGIALTTFASFVLAGAGLWATRTALHGAVDAAPPVGPVEHRLHGAAVAAIIVVVAMLAAGVTAAVVFSGPSTHPKPPRTGSGSGVAPAPHALGG